MKKTIIKIAFAFFVFSLFNSCTNLCESIRKKREARLPDEERDVLFFARLSSFVAVEDIEGFSSLFNTLSLQEIKRIVNRRNNEGRTFLHLAVLLENTDLLRLILSSGPNKDARDNFGKTAEDYARESKNKMLLSFFDVQEDSLRKEFEEDAKKEVDKEFNKPPKKEEKKVPTEEENLPKKEEKKPEKKGSVEKGGRLSSNPVTIDTVSYSYVVMLGDTASPFLKAVKNQDIAQVQKLLDEGRNVNESDSLGNNAIFYALLNDNLSMLNLLIRRGINCNFPNSADKYPLLYAVDRSDQKAVLALVERGANVNVTDGDGLSAVIIAAYRKSLEMLKLLNRCYASFSVKDMRGNTALHIAIQGEDVPTVRFLLQQIDVDVTVPNDAGITPLAMMRASRNAQIKRMAKKYEYYD